MEKHMPKESQIIQKTLIVDQVYQDIKNRIICGELKPKEKLSVRQLCEYYDISDTPIKQALNRLVSERLVDALPRRGMRVCCITKQDIHEAIEARMMIELYAIPYAIQSVQKDDTILESLKENIEKDEKLIQSLDNINHYSEKAMEELQVSQEFHLILVKCIQNSVILNAYLNIINHQYVYYQYGKDKSLEIIASLNEHKEIYSYLKAGDAEGMRRAIIEHLNVREKDATSVMD